VTGFRRRLEDRGVLVGDGAWGTMLMERGLEPGDCPESVNLHRPETLVEVAGLYLEAGADLITTNTFGGSPLNLASYGLADRTEEINRAAVDAVRTAVADRALVSASVGPTGKILAPYGDAEPNQLSEAFARQIGALLDAGVDVICIETMIDLAEAILAVKAVRSLSRTAPVIATMTFDPTPRGYFTAMGVTIEQASAGLAEAGADCVGSNCGNGMEHMVEIGRQFIRHSELPVVIQSNAGLPEHRNGALVYQETPRFMADHAAGLVDEGVAVIGGCCGTGPGHIRALREMVDRAVGSRAPG
jgi:5-methyltetrahydrofolate--homocysteine methyltransferase